MANINFENLDNLDYKKVDPLYMIDYIEKSPELYAKAFNLAKTITIPSFYIKPKKVVLLGMGGSGQANDVLRDYLKENTDLIVESVHNYTLPNYVDSDTLVIASSCSGNTEETLTAFVSAYEKGAKLIAITTGGKLKILAEKYKAPLFLYTYTFKPRAAFPYNFAFLYSIFFKLGYVGLSVEELNHSFSLMKKNLEKFGPNVSLLVNPAKILAQKIYDKIPVVYASTKLAGLASRFKAQLNENSNNFAFFELLPELNHNSIEGFKHPKDNVQVLFLESENEEKRILSRMELTQSFLKKERIPFEVIKFPETKGYLSEVMLFVYFCDFVSYYLAILNREDPAKNDLIDSLKAKLG